MAIDDLAKRSHPSMDALKMLKSTTRSRSAGAPWRGEAYRACNFGTTGWAAPRLLIEVGPLVGVSWWLWLTPKSRVESPGSTWMLRYTTRVLWPTER